MFLLCFDFETSSTAPALGPGAWKGGALRLEVVSGVFSFLTLNELPETPSGKPWFLSKPIYEPS